MNDRETFLAERRKGIGGSDVAAVVGLDPYRSPAQLYLEKTQAQVADLETAAMRRGNFLEDAVIDSYTRQLSPMKVERQIPHGHGTGGWMRGNQDARVTMQDGRKICVEVKTIRRSVRRKHWGEQWSDEVPDRVLCQGYWYGQLDDADIIHVVACVIPDDPDETMGLTAEEVVAASRVEVFEVPRDSDNEAMLYEAGRKFWFDHCVAGIAPPPTIGTGDHRDLWPSAKAGKIIQADTDLVADLKEYEKWKGVAQEAKSHSDYFAERIRIRMKDAESIEHNGVEVMTAKTVNRREHVVKASTSRPLRFKKAWSEQ